MTIKAVSLDHKKRLDGYWQKLKQLADRWEGPTAVCYTVVAFRALPEKYVE